MKNNICPCSPLCIECIYDNSPHSTMCYVNVLYNELTELVRTLPFCKHFIRKYKCPNFETRKRDLDKNSIINFISLFQNTDTINTFTNGCCYWFAYILHSRFPELEIMYDSVANHFVAGCDGQLYDITGDVTDKYNAVAWDDYNDEIHKNRIIRDCIELIGGDNYQ